MGVVNITPDSFSDGGDFIDPVRAIAFAERLVAQGADLIDIGGESTRPGAELVTLETERSRVLPVLTELVKMGIPVSVDTNKLALMHEVADQGACMINDITGVANQETARLIATKNIGVCVMHMKGAPKDMQDAPTYDDVVADVQRFLANRVNVLIDAGVSRESIVIDPGFGFGKTIDHNLTLLNNLEKIRVDGLPVLVGLSRKSMLGHITGKTDPKDRLGASISSAVLAAIRGADIIRVHDVNETKDALLIWRELERHK
ncbi:MAG: dihydropteroate synthase [Betaproteobacteria bacterium]